MVQRAPRKLTDSEKKKLKDFIPSTDLDSAVLIIGSMPWWLPAKRMRVIAITLKSGIYMQSYDENKIDDISTLGHELVHVGQYRLGLTYAAYVWSCRKGYDKSPFEQEAYAMGTKIQTELLKTMQYGFQG